MKENQPSLTKKTVKTYISEANQNNITDTLSVENNLQAPAEQDKQAASQSNDIATQANSLPPQAQEPEALSAQTFVWPPSSATPEAEAVAGLPIGALYEQEGDRQAATDSFPFEDEQKD
jgi:hypothetical protein